jgi:pyruvate dehydrogenase E1 component beta subunit
MMAQRALTAARRLEEEEGVSVEVIDPRTLHPFDYDTVFASLERTGRLVVVDEARRSCSLGSEVVARAAVERFDALQAAPRLVANPDLHVPYAPELEREVIPQVDDIVGSVLDVMHPVGAR